MIFIAAFEISGTYNGSQIEQGLKNLQQQLNSLKAPKIAPQVDMSGFFNQMDASASYATKGRMSKLFSGVDFGGIGRQAGGQYATSFMAGLGPIGGAASDIAMAIGPIGLAAGVAAAGVGLLAAKSVQAAAAWESMATSIGRTTGLDGKNLTDLMDSLQDLRMEMGITREAAAGLIEQAGSIGVGQAKLDVGDVQGYKKELLDFARSTAMLQGAWGMSAEATSAGIGKMGSVTIGAWNAQRRAMGEQELSWSDYAESVGGKVDSLANTMGSSEEEIVTAMRNASSAVASFAPTEDTYGKWLALTSFLIDTGASAGEAGTQIERMAKGAKQHGAELAQIIGMDNAQFQESLKTDFVGTFQAIAEELAAMPEGDRPDMIKLLGIEGSGAMDKMIADIKSGVGKLNKAIELDPSNITEGFEKVADDANTAFARIGQAAQVSFEQLGGVILPIVTDIANAIADSWQGMNVAGSEIWKAGQGMMENLSQGNVGDFALNGEWYNVSLSGIRKKTAEEIAAGAKQGAASASDAVADNLTSGIAEKVAEEFSAAQDAYIKSHPGGMSVVNGKIIGGNDDFEKKYKESWNRTLTTFPETYSMQKMVKTTGQSSGYLALLDEAGEEIKRLAFGAKYGYSDSAEAEREMEEMVKPVILDMPKYLKSVSSEMSGVLEDIVEDGVVTPLSEKPLLEGYLETLKDLEKEYKVEFAASGLDKLASDIQATLDGRAFSVDVKPEVDEFVANFALWKKSNAAVYEQIYAATGQIPTSTEQEERYKYEQKLAEEGSERSQSILRWLEEFDSALESNDVSSLVPIYETLLDYDPDLANQKWFTQLGEAGTSIAQKMMTAGDSAETLGGKFLDVASTMEAVNGRLMSLLSEARATTGMASWKQTVSQVNSSARKLNVPAGLTAAKTDTSYKISQFPGKLNIPKLAEGGKVTQGGLAWIGEAGPEIVIPEEDIKGLYPQSANVDKGSMSYLTSGRYFEDYPYEIRSESYKRGSFPNAPPVLTTGDMPVSWLSDPQTTGNEWISGEIRAAQLVAMGLTEENVLKTPKVAQALTNRDVWNAIYDNDGTCIAFVEPDPSLNFTPGADYMPGGKRWGNLDLPLGSYYGGSSSFYGGGVAATTPGGWLSGKSSTPVTSAITAPSDALVMPGGINTSDALTRRTAWNAIYDNNGTCIAFVEPDPSLNFTPGVDYLPGGKGLGNMGGGYTSLGDQEISTWDSVAESTRDTATATEKVVENTRQNLIQTQRVADGLVMASSGYGGYGGYGGSSILGLANRGGAAYWGGTSISGGGGWIAASPGPASGSSTAAWMNAGARAVGGSGAIQWAEGGITDHPVFGVFGEAGREAFVPISDRAAGLRILPRVMQELGVATFAQGGIVQSQSVSGSGAVSSTLGQTIINGEASNQYATHSDGSLVSRGDINLSVYGDVARPQIREMMEQLKREWKEERDELVRILRQARFGGHY